MSVLSLPVLSTNVVPVIKGNAKLSKGTHRIVGFGLPADTDYTDPTTGEVRNTCEAALACRGVCYAKQGRYLFANVANARAKALAAVLDGSFVANMVMTLGGYGNTYDTVRVHDSGDFLSEQNLRDWYSIARKLPHLTFYAYTKRMDLGLFKRKPRNFRIIQSYGGKHDALIDPTKPHSRIFATREDMERAGYVDGNVSDDPAIDGVVKIGLVYHGVKKLTDGQKKFFR